MVKIEKQNFYKTQQFWTKLSYPICCPVLQHGIVGQKLRWYTDIFDAILLYERKETTFNGA
jgi:hypothetical protein